MTGAVVRAYATELSVRCDGGGLRSKVDGLTLRTTCADLEIYHHILSKPLGVLERRVHWLLLRAQVVGNIV